MPSLTISILFVLGAFLFLYFVPKLQIYKIRRKDEPKGPLELENDYRQTLVQILGGIIIIATIASAIENSRLARESLALSTRSFELARQGQVADRTFKALELLSKEQNKDSRFSAIYALAQLANEYPDSEWQVTETLFNYLQDHSAWPPQSRQELRYQPRDVSAITDYLKRRPYIGGDGKCLEEHQCWDYEKRGQPSETDIPGYYNRIINLPGLDLRKIFLDRAMLKTANINQSHLEQSWLRHAHFENAYGLEAHLSNADLSDSYWQFANLKNADLSGAQLCRAHFEHVYAEGSNLSNADLSGSHWDNPRQIRVPNLRDADLTCTTWSGANMEGLYLEGAKLFGADLRGATHLTRDQLEKAQGDGSTMLSDENLRPSMWSPERTICSKIPLRPFCPPSN